MKLTAALTSATIRTALMSPMPSIVGDGEPRVAPSDSSEQSYVQPTLGHGLRIWWAFYWRNTVISAILFAGLILVMRPWYNAGYIPDWYYLPLLRFGPYVIGYAVAIPVFYMILRKSFRKFRIGLISSQDAASEQLLSVTLGRTLRVWWTFSWRTLIFGLIVSFVASFPLGILVGALSALLPRLTGMFDFLSQLAIGGAVGLFVIYNSILDEDFSDFRVTLLPRKAPAQVPAPAPATPSTTA